MIKNISAWAIIGLLAISPVQAVATETASTSTGATVTESENQGMGNDAAKECIGQAESNGNYSVVNKPGFLGKYQVGEGKLIDLGYAANQGSSSANNDNRNIQWTGKDGITSTEAFLNCASCQEKIKDQIDKLTTSRLGSAMGAVGKTIDCGGTPTTVTSTMLTQGAQFGEGKVRAWYNNGMNCVSGVGTPTNDGNGKCVTYMMCAASKCNTVTKDMNKKTCSVTMPMVQAISCSNFTGANLALCNYAKPHLMTQGECDGAEAWAKSVPKGPHGEKCENSSFGPGTGSWSYVLACSYASEHVADQNGVPNSSEKSIINPIPEDPNCKANLEAAGKNFKWLGTYSAGTTLGTNCLVVDGVTSPGTSIPWGPSLEFNCTMLKTLEEFSDKIKALGVTEYRGVSSVACRPIVNNKGTSNKTVSNHAFGKAFDFASVVVGGRVISMDAVRTPGTPDGVIATQIRSIACSTFSGVLTQLYSGYAGGKWVHNHVDIQGKYCR